MYILLFYVGWSDSKSGWVAVVIAVGCAVIAACCLPLLKRRAQG